MTLITWNDRFATGIPQVDDDHRRIMGIINRIDDALIGDQSRQVDSGTLEELAKYAEEHFALEEQLMESSGFPGLEAHRQEHHRARMLLLGLRNQHLDGRVVRSSDALSFLSTWLSEHILGTDLAYVEHLKVSGLVPPAP